MKQTKNVKQRLVLGYSNKALPQVPSELLSLKSAIEREFEGNSNAFLKVLDYLLQIEVEIQKTNPAFRLK